MQKEIAVFLLHKLSRVYSEFVLSYGYVIPIIVGLRTIRDKKSYFFKNFVFTLPQPSSFQNGLICLIWFNKTRIMAIFRSVIELQILSCKMVRLGCSRNTKMLRTRRVNSFEKMPFTR